jgi:hypothetical protein
MRPVRVPVEIPAGGVTPVLITPEPGAEPAPPGDPRTLSLRIADVRVRPA